MAADPVDLCTVQQVKDAFEPAIAGTGRDAIIERAITNVSRQIIGLCERELTPKTDGQARLLQVPLERNRDGSVTVDLTPWDLRAATLVELHPEATTPTTLVADRDYLLEPLGAPQGGYKRLLLSRYAYVLSDHALRFGYARLRVTGNWGLFDTGDVPAELREACVLTVRAFIRQNPQAYAFERGDRSLGELVEIPDTFTIPTGAMRALHPWLRWTTG
ncbi:MAG: hypothetical protein R3C15_15490 [Thermoleophilia bacterium]